MNKVMPLKTTRVEEFLKEMEQRLPIDKDRLEDELQTQHEHYYDVAKELALATSRAAEAKKRLKEEQASFGMEYRRTAKQKNEKCTEREVEEATALDNTVEEIEEAILKCNKQVGLLTALRDAFRDRHFDLIKLVDLWRDRYYMSEKSTVRARNGMENVETEMVRKEYYKRRREENDL